MHEPDDPVSVRRSELIDAPEYSGLKLRLDGTLGTYIRGRGLVAGPMSPAQLRGLAAHLEAVADIIDQRGRAASAEAAAALDDLVSGPNGDR